MSISSIAEDSALRLTPRAQPTPSASEVAAIAAATAATAAKSEGVTLEAATHQGARAGQQAQSAAAVATAAPASPLSQLVKYVPTESISLYVAIQAALGDISPPASGRVSDADFASRWWWVVIMLAATVALTLGLSYRSQKIANKDARFKVPVFEVAAAGAAFLVWALSLPSTPLRDFSGYDYSSWNSVLILAGTVAVATSAYVFGKTVSWTKVVDP
jgi:uncharacterized membrane protein YhaH (DUF805 family)